MVAERGTSGIRLRQYFNNWRIPSVHPSPFDVILMVREVPLAGLPRVIASILLVSLQIPVDLGGSPLENPLHKVLFDEADLLFLELLKRLLDLDYLLQLNEWLLVV